MRPTADITPVNTYAQHLIYHCCCGTSVQRRALCQIPGKMCRAVITHISCLLILMLLITSHRVIVYLKTKSIPMCLWLVLKNCISHTTTFLLWQWVGYWEVNCVAHVVLKSMSEHEWESKTKTHNKQCKGRTGTDILQVIIWQTSLLFSQSYKM